MVFRTLSAQSEPHFACLNRRRSLRDTLVSVTFLSCSACHSNIKLHPPRRDRDDDNHTRTINRHVNTWMFSTHGKKGRGRRRRRKRREVSIREDQSGSVRDIKPPAQHSGGLMEGQVTLANMISSPYLCIHEIQT